MPWFAIVAIVGIGVWGLVMILSMILGKPLPGTSSVSEKELQELRDRLEALESGAGQPAVERRIERIEARLDKREARELEQDGWDRQARDLGLGED
ncbi:hypothetical protein M3D92_11340 [Micrococcus terreus]|uniref:hypothetical protein n=1 Tax=Micrococcus terreus TaxID=574650 RepID=UPI0021A27924|nr:hypothetical protein [Micrococcus terreus]MCT2089876.1 hypothetical protein [Micrococcus terreus]